jgi:hypothetical protein
VTVEWPSRLRGQQEEPLELWSCGAGPQRSGSRFSQASSNHAAGMASKPSPFSPGRAVAGATSAARSRSAWQPPRPPHLAEDAVYYAVREAVVAIPQQIVPRYPEIVVCVGQGMSSRLGIAGQCAPLTTSGTKTAWCGSPPPPPPSTPHTHPHPHPPHTHTPVSRSQNLQYTT